ncbi:hypothetical protein SDC9_117163 [bioreactor metagenome]|uniref:Uncharacterized protein n=1 Tax=bioreactor metagenome TaxID=1076179 RepID=A0A645BXJ7_9ZZZZ
MVDAVEIQQLRQGQVDLGDVAFIGRILQAAQPFDRGSVQRQLAVGGEICPRLA